MGPYLLRILRTSLWALLPAVILFLVSAAVVYRQALGVEMERHLHQIAGEHEALVALSREEARRQSQEAGPGPLAARAHGLGLRWPTADEIHLLGLRRCPPLEQLNDLPYPAGEHTF